MFPLLLSLLSFTPSTIANTEKTIISGPPPIPVPSQTYTTLSDLHIPTLTPSNWSIRHHVPAAFPSPASPNGLSSWYLLDELTANQGYEVRVCWAATQPTTFTLTTYTLQTAFDTPSLIESLNDYALSRILDDNGGERAGDTPKEASLLLLHIQAAADYFSASTTLMSEVPPVFIDVILDPHIIPGVPRSLLPTIGCAIVVAVGSFFLAGKIPSALGRIAASPAGVEKKKQ